MKLKKLKNKKIIISILLLIIGLLAINYTFFKPTKINFYIASKLYKTPANTAFTDDNFYKCVVDNYNRENKSSEPYSKNLTDEQLKSITGLFCNTSSSDASDKINNVDGIEKLTGLQYLSLHNNLLTGINLNSNKELIKISLTSNKLTKIDLSDNIKLTELYLGGTNKLTELDVSNNTELEILDINGYKKVEISQYSISKSSEGGDNRLVELNLNGNKKLSELYADNNLLTTLDASNNPELTDLSLDNNQLTNLDLSNNPKLTDLSLDNNQLTNLDLSNNLLLRRLSIMKNKLTNLTLDNHDKLESLLASDNELTNIGLSSTKSLKRLNISNNKLNSIDVSKCLLLEILDIDENQLTNLDISCNPNLQQLSASHTDLTGLNLSNNLELQQLYIQYTKLTYLDLSKNTKLKNIYASKSELTSIIIGSKPELNTIDVAYNQLTSLDLNLAPILKSLYTNDNQLISLDLSGNLEIKYLYADDNNLTALDLSKNINLEVITINNNPYSENLNCYKGNNIQLGNNVKLSSHIAITNNWKSQDNSIATVDNNGVATTLKTGTVTITNDNNKYKTTSMLNIIEITSDKYVINNDKNYIYIGTDLINENIIGNFNIPKDINLTITPDNKLQVKYNEDILKEFTLINVLSGVYNLTNDYIYVGTDQLDLTKINITNGSIVQEENQLKLKREDTILKTWDIISISQEKYLLGNNYIYVGTNDLDLEKINIINATLVNEDEKLKVKYREQIIYEYNILSIDFKELSVKGNSIVITEDIPYEDFTNNITPNGVTYKIYDGEDEVTEGTITKDMILKIYKDEEEIYEYQITDEFLDLTLLTIDEEESLIKNLKLGTAISSFKENILTSGSVKILDQDGEELKDTDLVRSGAKVVIELSKDTYEYTLSVKGDVTGTGKSTVSDVGKLYQYLRKKIPMDKCYIEAGNVIDTDNEIKITDVGKLYQFIKGKIDSLED